MAISYDTQHRPPIWRNVTVLKWGAQIVVLGAVAAVFWILGSQASANIADRGLSFGWKWLDDPPLISIFEGIDLQPDSGARALTVGIVNMLRVSVSGIFAATILGTIIGIGRLSGNWIVNKVATVYIETIRNVPLLVQIFFWFAVVKAFSALTEGSIGTHWFAFSSKGIGVPWLFPSIGFWQWMVFIGIGFALAPFVYRWRVRVQEATGAPSYALTAAFATVVVLGVIGWFAHPIMGFLSSVWEGLADFFHNVPVGVLQALLALAAVAAAAWWIKRFLDSRRTAAGLAKLTDDDYFRIIFAGLVGLAFAGLFLIQSGIADLILTGFGNFFDFFADKFHGDSGSPLRGSRPAVEQSGRFVNFSSDGLVVTPPFFAIWVGVTLYTAAFIAEIVRGGILAVPRGQSEAGGAVGLRRGQLLRLVVLPQAFRIILPPLGNQYLNLAKNTSLGIAVAFPDIVQVGQTLYNQTGQSLPVVVTWMGFYLTVSLIISVIVNYYNRKMMLVER